MTAKPTAIRGLSEISIDYSEAGVTSRTPAACVELLYVEHFTAIYRYLVLSGSSPADADEIAQETFLRLFTWLSRGQRVEKPRPWLMSVAHNLRLGELQRAARNAEVDRQYPADRAPTPEQVVLQNERLRRLRAAMMQLTSRQRSYLHLRAEGLRLKEIAEMHGVTLQSVAEACSRAIQILGRLSNE